MAGTNRPAVRPSGIWYGVGGALAVIGVVGAILWIVIAAKALVDRVDDLQRVEFPGQGVVTFDEPGDYTLYLETPGVSDVEPEVPEDLIVMRPVRGGEPIEFTEYEGDFSYDWGGHEGRAVLTFEITEAGTYRVESETDFASTEGEVALGPGLIGDLPRQIVLALALGFLALAGAAAIIAVTAVRRHRARKAQGAPPAGSYPPQQQYPPQQPYPQQPYPQQPYPQQPYPQQPYPQQYPPPGQPGPPPPA